MPTSRLAPTRVRLLADGALRRDLFRLQGRAHAANLRTLGETVVALDSATRILAVDRAEDVARLARAVVQQADRLATLKRLREYERQLVERGLAEWLEVSP